MLLPNSLNIGSHYAPAIVAGNENQMHGLLAEEVFLVLKEFPSGASLATQMNCKRDKRGRVSIGIEQVRAQLHLLANAVSSASGASCRQLCNRIHAVLFLLTNWHEIKDERSDTVSAQSYDEYVKRVQLRLPAQSN